MEEGVLIALDGILLPSIRKGQCKVGQGCYAFECDDQESIQSAWAASASGRYNSGLSVPNLEVTEMDLESAYPDSRQYLIVS